jgi:uncharacterized small protein (DUF1192 family)
MELKQLNCVSCGSPISIPEDLEYLNCAACGSFLAIQRGEGFVALKIAEKISRAIEDSNRETQETIRQTSEGTQYELRRMQLQYELSTSEMKLTHLQSEIRSHLKSEPKDPSSLQELRFLEYKAYENLREIKYKLATLDGKKLEILIPALTEQLAILKHSKIALSNANKRHFDVKQEVIKVNALEAQLSKDLSNYKTQLIAKDLITYKQQLPEASKEDVAASLVLIDKDLTTLKSLSESHERKTIETNIKQQHDRFYKKWLSFEEEDISTLLASSQVEHMNLLSVNEIETAITLLQQDITMLTQRKNNDAVGKYLNILRNKEKKLTRQLQMLHAQERRATNQSSSGLSAAFAGFMIIVSAFFADIFNKQAANKPLAERKPDISNQNFVENVDLIQATENTPKRINSTILLGFIVSIAASFTTLCLGFTAFAVASSGYKELTSTQTGLVFTIILIAHIFGSIAFFGVIAPAAGYTFPGMKNAVGKRPTTVSFTSIKIFAAIAAFLGGILLVLNIMMFLPSESNATVALFCAGRSSRPGRSSKSRTPAGLAARSAP